MKPTPQQVRDWMNQRQVVKTPPPTLEKIRQELGWNLIKVVECAR